MGRSRYKVVEAGAPHFLTCTVVNWICLFTRPATAQILLDSLDFLQQNKRWRLYGYVILENHIHLIAQSPDLGKDIASFKSFTAGRIVEHLEEQGITRILKQLAYHKRADKHDRQHQIWQEGAHPQWLQNEAMLRQKLEYIHSNPVKRGYVDQAEDWRYSSARNYAGREGLIPVSKDWF